MEKKRYLIVDLGSTTTKALLFETEGAEVRLLGGADAPTTVEAPYNDVKLGLFQAVNRLEAGLNLPLSDEKVFLQTNPNALDGLLATSSAGGGLQMLVIGLVKGMTAESAERAALGAGAVILDVMAQDDGLEMYSRIARIRELRPDMVLMAGGIEGGALLEVAVLADGLFKAAPKSRLGAEKIPLIFAGNSELRPYFENNETNMDVRFVENLRPALDQENLAPTRKAIQDVFLNHVMTQAPGYAGVQQRVSAPILPTPTAVGKSLQLLAQKRGCNVMAMDIGGATTDVFSVVNGEFYRTVSANLGMSYSAMHVLAEAGVENILRWLPETLAEADVRDWLHNKMLRPTTLPYSKEALLVEQALAREALRLSLAQHFNLAVALRGNKPEGDWKQASADAFGTHQLFSIRDIDLLIGSGGVISHAPQAMQSAMMMIDGFLPVGYTELALDHSFMLPHAGVFSQVNEAAALNILETICLQPLGCCIAPTGYGFNQEKMGKITIKQKPGTQQHELRFGQLHVIPLPAGEEAEVEISGHLKLNYGRGFWKPFHQTVKGGSVGIIVDLRGRDLRWEKSLAKKRQQSKTWLEQVDISGRGI